MSFLADFIPLVVFFILYKMYGIYVATLAAIVISTAQVLYSRYRTGRFDRMQLVTLALLVVFGGATLLAHDERYIKWKVTAVYALFALVLFVSHFTKQTILQRMLGKQITLSATLWHRMNASWALFFAGLAIANSYVATHFSTDTWVNFKLFGVLGLTIVFIVIQGIFLARYLKKSNV